MVLRQGWSAEGACWWVRRGARPARRRPRSRLYVFRSSYSFQVSFRRFAFIARPPSSDRRLHFGPRLRAYAGAVDPLSPTWSDAMASANPLPTIVSRGRFSVCRTKSKMTRGAP